MRSLQNLFRACRECYYLLMSVERDVEGGAVSISVLSQRSGVSVATIKYYIREGLIRSTLDPKADDVETVNQLRLIRGLVHVVGLSIRQVRKILNLVRDPELSPAALMTSVTADLPLAGARVADDTDLAGARAALASVGFDELPDVPYVNQLLAAIALAEENGVGMDAEHLAAYTAAARECAKSDFDHMLFDSPSREVQTAVLGTLIYDSILIGVRRLAHRELVDQLTPFQSQ